ncbi:MAG: PAS domain S-box protein [Bryobacterales bacterium]|nr:PAS domain S-box protein [Bryobacterales bacterium]
MDSSIPTDSLALPDPQLRSRATALDRQLLLASNDLDNLLGAAGLGVIFLDRRLCIRRFTSAVNTLFCLAEKDVGQPIAEFASHFEHPNLAADLDSVLASASPIEREIPTRANTWLLLRILPYRTETGATDGLVLTFTDITVMRRAQQELLHSESHFREMADFVNAIFWITSPDGSTVHYVSPGYEKLWKRSLESLCENPASWLKALHPEDRADFLRAFAARNLEEEWEEQYRIVWPDGAVRWIRDRRYPVRDSHGNVIRVAGISVDVTEMKASQQRLELTQFAIDNAGDMVFWASPEGRILYANNSAARCLGYSREALLSFSMPQLDQRRAASAWPEFVAHLKVEGFVTSESRYRASDGREFPVEISSTCLHLDNTFYCCFIARDIAQRKYSEKELSRYASELERANESLRHHNRELDEFAYLASHDLKEPLRAITTFSQLLTQDVGADLPEDAVRDLEFITSAATRMQRLITDLLALSRAGRVDMHSASVNLHACALSALDAISVGLRESGAEIRIANPLPTVTGDATMLTQLFQNLLSNALKFRGPGKPLIEITATRTAAGWIFGVRDNGVGIKAEYAEKVFQPFRRVHVQSGQEGTGIGLAICRKVVERHGGHIWVESSPNAGAHFYFTLGRTEREPAHAS